MKENRRDRTMRKETVRIGKIDTSREREFLRKYNLIAKEVLMQNGEQESHEQKNGYGSKIEVRKITRLESE